MPEGDTIHRAALSLDKALRGREASELRADGIPGPRPAVPVTVVGVEARGKHLLMGFEDGITLHTHMGMNGSWHIYHPGERWRVPAHRARVVVRTSGLEAVCFSPQVAELLRTKDLATHRQLSRLGPDLSRADTDLDEAAQRLAGVPGAEVGVALLDQRVASGIGNVYRSEILFLAGVHPFSPVGSLGPDVGRKLMDIASRLLRANLGSVRRTTVAEGLAVYDRTGRPCVRCGTVVRSARQGTQARMVYWCPFCQPEVSG